MHKMLEFSIIVPCYNVKKYIERCVNSVINQTYGNWELLLIDDESEDDTLRVIEKIKDNDRRIKVFAKQHGGLPHTRNYGMQYVTGDYLCLLDGDDYWEEKHLEKLTELLKHTLCDMVIQNQVTYLKSNIVWMVELFPNYGNNLTHDEKLHAVFSKNNKLPASAVMTTYRIDFLKKNQLCYDDSCSCSEDLDFFLHAISYDPHIIFAYHEFYYYRQDNLNAMTKNMTGAMGLDRICIYKKWIDYYFEHNIDKFDGKLICKKLARDLCVQWWAVYRAIPKRDKDKKRVRRFFYDNRYLFTENGEGAYFIYENYIKHPISCFSGGLMRRLKDGFRKNIS